MSKSLIVYFSHNKENYFSGNIVNLEKGNVQVIAETFPFSKLTIFPEKYC